MKIVIVHGWGVSPEGNFRPWLKTELEKRGHEVVMPQMPNPDNPIMQEWTEKLVETIGDDEVWLSGHSLGCIAILRYLEQASKKVEKAVLVAGFVDNLNIPEIENFFEKEFDWRKIKENCEKFVFVNSDNDRYVPVDHGSILQEKLGGEFILMTNMGHFMGGEGVTELPIALEKILE